MEVTSLCRIGELVGLVPLAFSASWTLKSFFLFFLFFWAQIENLIARDMDIKINYTSFEG
jgi:hypothetical protein